MILLAVALAFVLALAYPFARNRLAPLLLSQRVRSVVIVTLKSRSAFKGVLAESDSEVVVLRNAQAIDGGENVIVDGEVILLRADIEYLQRP